MYCDHWRHFKQCSQLSEVSVLSLSLCVHEVFSSYYSLLMQPKIEFFFP